jgi:monoamine oxidase
MSEPRRIQPWTRRDFLQWGSLLAGGAVASSATGCAQLDRMIVGDGADETKRVMILGGGIAGLVAARELRKNNVSYRIFEGSSRIGGRLFSLPEFNEAGQAADLGAEWFSDEDDFLLSLCRELKIDLEVISEINRTPWHLSMDRAPDKISAERDYTHFRKQVLELKSRKTDKFLDAMSVAELLDSNSESLSAPAKAELKMVARRFCAEDLEKVSALLYLDRVGEDPSGQRELNKQKFRIAGGAQNLAYALYDKIAGVVPDYLFLKNHRLVEVRTRGKLLRMIFETPQGQFTIEAHTVICTLPLSCLRQVKGLENLGFSDHKLKLIQDLRYATAGKIVSSFGERFWSDEKGTWLDLENSAWIWDSTPPGKVNIPVRRGLLSYEVYGDSGAQLGIESLEGFKKALPRIYVRAESRDKNFHAAMETWQMMNWSLNPWALGSSSYLGTGQVTQFAGSLATSELKGRFIFAGEHTSYDSLGRVNGAVESGVRAALEAMKFRGDFK